MASPRSERGVASSASESLWANARTAQIEMLILKRVGEIVCHYGPLAIEIDPVSQMKFAAFWIVIAGTCSVRRATSKAR